VSLYGISNHATQTDALVVRFGCLDGREDTWIPFYVRVSVWVAQRGRSANSNKNKNKI
jgi:hypothetical protein